MDFFDFPWSYVILELKNLYYPLLAKNFKKILKNQIKNSIFLFKKQIVNFFFKLQNAKILSFWCIQKLQFFKKIRKKLGKLVYILSFITVFENHRKVSFNIASEASYVYILSGQKFIKNAKNG